MAIITRENLGKYLEKRKFVYDNSLPHHHMDHMTRRGPIHFYYDRGCRQCTIICYYKGQNVYPGVRVNLTLPCEHKWLDSNIKMIALWKREADEQS